MRLDRDLIPIALSVAAFGTGIAVATFGWRPNAEWLGFAGALIGSAVTVAGSVGVLEWQRGNADREQQAFLLRLLDDVESACAPFQLGTASDLIARYGHSVRQQIEEVRGAIRRIENFKNSFQAKTIGTLKAYDHLDGLEFGDQSLDSSLTAYVLYPESADLGQLNFLANDVLGSISKARRELNG